MFFIYRSFNISQDMPRGERIGPCPRSQFCPTNGHLQLAMGQHTMASFRCIQMAVKVNVLEFPHYLGSCVCDLILAKISGALRTQSTDIQVEVSFAPPVLRLTGRYLAI